MLRSWTSALRSSKKLESSHDLARIVRQRLGCPLISHGYPCSLSDDDARPSFLYGTGHLRFRMGEISKVFGYVVDLGAARSS